MAARQETGGELRNGQERGVERTKNKGQGPPPPTQGLRCELQEVKYDPLKRGQRGEKKRGRREEERQGIEGRGRGRKREKGGGKTKRGRKKGGSKSKVKERKGRS